MTHMKARDTDKTQLITFYSYKGGVGRTMALANAACQLAIKHGKDVICIDWDLEAPGLHHYFGYTDKELAGKAGLLDYLLDFVWQVTQKGAQGQVPQLDVYLQPLKPKDQEKITHGSVRLMHCGRTDPNYMARVQEFDWERFYRDQSGYQIIETLKQQLRKAADITLIDARAGQADIGATPTLQMPDGVVLLFTSNRQSLDGAETIARRLANHPRRGAQAHPPPKILLVPARVFPVEDRFLTWLRRSATPVYDRLAQDDIVSKRDQPRGLLGCSLPVDPKHSIDEKLVIIEAEPVPSKLKEAYTNLAQALDNLYYGRDAWSIPPRETVRAEATHIEAIREKTQAAVDRGDRERVALFQFELALNLIELGRHDEADPLVDAALTYSRNEGTRLETAVIRATKARIHKARGRFDEAWAECERSQEIMQDTDDPCLQALVVHEMGDLRHDQMRFDEAWDLYQQALQLAEEGGDRARQVAVLLEMGNLRRNQQRVGDAQHLYERALNLAQCTGDVFAEGIILHKMGHLCADQARYQQARSFFAESLKRKEQVQDPQRAITLHAMAMIQAQLDDFDGAMATARRGAERAKVEGDKDSEAALRALMSEIENRQTHHPGTRKAPTKTKG